MSDPLPAPERQPMDDVDRAISAALRKIAAPADLPARILAAERDQVRDEGKIVHGPWFTPARVLLAAAALIVAAFVFIGNWSQGQSFEQFRERVATRDAVNTIAGKAGLEMQDKRLSTLEEYLRSASAPAVADGFKAPADFAPVGCRTFRWRGMVYSMVCFYDDKGRGIHLFMARETLFHDRPGGVPTYAKVGGLETASWSKSGTSFVLVAAPGVEIQRAMESAQG